MLTSTPSSHGLSQAGYTMVELVMVIVLVGIIAAVAVVRLSNSSSTAGEVLHTETMTALRLAQKMAIAQRRSVCATFSASRMQVWIRTGCDTGCDASCSAAAGCDATTVATDANWVRLSLPGRDASTDTDGDGTPDGNMVYRSGVFYSTYPASPIMFDCRGRNTAGSAQSIQVDGLGIGLTVEHETGYVH